MTPLAYQTMKLLFNAPDRIMFPCESNKDPTFLIDVLNDVHCFEVTDIRELSIEFLNDLFTPKLEYDVSMEALMSTFILPASNTWFEFESKTKSGSSTRGALVALSDDKTKDKIHVMVSARSDERVSFLIVGTFRLDHSGVSYWIKETFVSYVRDHSSQFESPDGESVALAFMKQVIAFCCVLAMPNMATKTAHKPHKNLMRVVSRAGSLGGFAVNDWVEYRLSLSAKGRVTEAMADAELRAKRRRHYVRSFVRMKRDKLEYVTGYWRGDASLGVKNKIYNVTP